jgi:hypothetical protein
MCRSARRGGGGAGLYTLLNRACPMELLLLEALAALVLLVFIVWWTMFSGRRRGERDDGEG